LLRIPLPLTTLKVHEATFSPLNLADYRIGIDRPQFRARRSSGWDRFYGNILAIGPRTDALIDLYGKPDSIIPCLRRMCETVRNTRWEQTLMGGQFRMTAEQARAFAVALEQDICQGAYGLGRHVGVSTQVHFF